MCSLKGSPDWHTWQLGSGFTRFDAVLNEQTQNQAAMAAQRARRVMKRACIFAHMRNCACALRLGRLPPCVTAPCACLTGPRRHVRLWCRPSLRTHAGGCRRAGAHRCADAQRRAAAGIAVPGGRGARGGALRAAPVADGAAATRSGVCGAALLHRGLHAQHARCVPGARSQAEVQLLFRVVRCPLCNKIWRGTHPWDMGPSLQAPRTCADPGGLLSVLYLLPYTYMC